MAKLIKSELKVLFEESQAEIAKASTDNELEKLRVGIFGVKGFVKSALKQLKDFGREEKIELATFINKEAAALESIMSERKVLLGNIGTSSAASPIDFTLPGTFGEMGAPHPISHISQVCAQALRQLGFSMHEGLEAESAFYNFDALNIPEHHPARDMQDTFWLDRNSMLLRTHTTSYTARVLEMKPPLPVKIGVIGRVYRNEAVDATHLAMFHQLDGLWLAKGLAFSHLKGVTAFLARSLYGENCVLRYKPKYYPYTEPSVGIDLQCSLCSGTGCSGCHQSGWVTIMGAGLVHHLVLEKFGYDPDEVKGIAFGWGITRMAAQFFGINKLKPLYEGNTRILKALNGEQP